MVAGAFEYEVYVSADDGTGLGRLSPSVRNRVGANKKARGLPRAFSIHPGRYSAASS